MKRRMRNADELNNQETKERRWDGNIQPPTLKSETENLNYFNRGWTRMMTGISLFCRGLGLVRSPAKGVRGLHAQRVTLFAAIGYARG